METYIRKFVSFSPLIFLIIDTASGFLLLNGVSLLSISIFYKFTFILCCMAMVFSNDGNGRVHCLMFTLYILLWMVVGLFVGRENYILGHGIELFKLFSTFYVFYAVILLNCEEYLIIRKFYLVTLLVLVFNVFISIAGIGFKSYGDYGAKGFIYGGNILSGVIVILSVFYMFKSNSIIRLMLVYFVFVTLAYLVGTKSSILGVTVALLMILAYDMNIKSFLKLLLPISFAVLSFGMWREWFLETPMFDRLSFFYADGGLIQLIFSGRIEFLSALWSVFTEQGTLTYLFGLDYNLSMRLEHNISEMDITDIILSFGLLTLLLYLSSFYIVIKKVLCCQDALLKRVSICTTMILIIIGAIAGHVLFNGVITPFMGVVLALPILDCKYREDLK